MAISPVVNRGLGDGVSHNTICSTEARSSGVSSHPVRTDGKKRRSKDDTNAYTAFLMVSNLADARGFRRTSTDNGFVSEKFNGMSQRYAPCTVHLRGLGAGSIAASMAGERQLEWDVKVDKQRVHKPFI